MKRRDFIKKTGKVVLATATISLTGISILSCSSDDSEDTMGSFCDGYYTAGYYTDGYYEDGYYIAGYYTDGYYTDGYSC
jgi:hypothetical protein